MAEARATDLSPRETPGASTSAVKAMQAEGRYPEARERWFIGHAGDLARWGFDVRDLREQAREHGDAAAMAGVALIREYLRGL